jgi:hypothetical protein
LLVFLENFIPGYPVGHVMFPLVPEEAVGDNYNCWSPDTDRSSSTGSNAIRH